MKIRAAILFIAFSSALLLLASCGDEETDTATTETAPPAATGTGTTETATTATDAAESLEFTFDTPKKSAHYETNTPAHEAVLAAVPINVVIDFNFDLAPPSEIRIMMDGQEYGVGDTVIDDNSLSMRRDMDPNAPDGLYRVEYDACWPDGSCHDGHFQFGVDSSLQTSFEDMTGQTEVTVELMDFSFFPQRLLIDAGTTVTWVNVEADEIHFVNTDSHPAHTYYPPQNSRSLEKDGTFTLTFDKPGSYPYHCSAHADFMIGEIVVR